jgi:ankyrin repeat protein
MQPHEVDDRDSPSPDWTRPPEPAIHRAARHGDVETLVRLIDEGGDVDERADLEHDNGPHLNGLTTLMVAARSIDGASVETLRRLVEKGADIHARSDGGNTAAWYAAGHGGRWQFHEKAVTPDHVERLRYLLDLGLDANECNGIGRSLLTEACSAGDPARVALLLERGVSPVVGTQQAPGSPLLNRILQRIRPGKTRVPTGTASSSEIPLFCAAESGSAKCVQLLLDAGVNPNTRDDSGETPLMSAGSADVVRVLLEAGADRDAVDEFGKDAFQSILEESCDADRCGPERFDVARALLDAGVDLEQRGRYGKARLASAAFGHHADAVEFLVSVGARADARDSDGGTPLHAICWQGEYSDEETNQACERIIRVLVEAGVSVDAEDRGGQTAMHEAAAGDWGNATAIRTLLALGAAVDPADKQGVTPLMLAAGNGETACIKLLLGAGADPKRADKDGDTALDAASSNVETWKEIVADGPEKLVDDVEEFLDADATAELRQVFAGQEDTQASTLKQALESLEMLERVATAARHDVHR